MSRFRLNLVGVAILLIGLGSVAMIERNARIQEANSLEDTEATHALLHPEDSREYMRNAEMMGGKLGVLLNSWLQNVEDLGHSRPFAIAIAAVSLVAAAAVFTSSNLSSRE